jgi:hypothetical protein
VFSSFRRSALRKRFCLVLLKPTHYCDEGYPIQWLRSAVPSNSLACVYGIAKQCADARVLGEDVEFEIHAIDEANTRVDPGRYIRQIRAAGAGMVMLVGVQSNQMPRALDIARPLRDAGIQVSIGGFHVSGVISMINGDDDALRAAQAMGISIYAGEAEGRLDEVLRDAYAGELKPLYNYMSDLPGLASTPGAAARSSARSAPSSTCRAANRGAAHPTTSRRSSGPTWQRASTAFS